MLLRAQGWLRQWFRRWAGRRGRLLSPAGTGRLLWIRADASRDSVLLGVELARALRERRQDVRIALTFQEDHPELLRERLRGLERVGVGYGPADDARAVRRVLHRLAPSGVVIAGGGVPQRLVHALKTRSLPVLTVNTAGASAQSPAAPEPDLLTLVTPAQIDTTLRSALCPDGLLWWVQTDDAGWARACQDAWRASALAEAGVLLIGSGRRAPALAGLPGLSEWTREAQPLGSVHGVDEVRWLPAVAASSAGVVLDRPERFVRWQVLAGGAAACTRSAPDAILETVGDAAGVVARWRAESGDALLRRSRGDAGRRAFWSERRNAAAHVALLLDEIYRW
ncbi:MAG TPA: glycosyltransferase N-terminal domain-containing protein [Acidiferrobacteraceae bacterium]|nr:glycosyltransferase N-terminal domain-containing protein [Acidiferrobacteraceae bacterium]